MCPRETTLDNCTDFTNSTKILSLDSFIPSCVGSPYDPRSAERNFKTFLVSPATNRSSFFRKALNTAGEHYGLKSPLFASDTKTIDSRRDTEKAFESSKLRQQSLFKEYQVGLAVSHLKGFPRIYGLGQYKGWPIIVSEYLEGPTLAQAIKLPPQHKGCPGGIEPTTVASIGKAILRMLLNTRSLSGTFVHRDLSLSNILMRTSHKTLPDQIAQQDFDMCLVDMGSSLYQENENANLAGSVEPGNLGTPEFAPPEMLTANPPEAVSRASETIDTYALCSILFLLITGRTPFSLSMRTDKSPYQIKTTETPQTALASMLNDRAAHSLLNLAMKGIKNDQSERYSLLSLYDALTTWEEEYGDSNRLRKEPPPPSFSLASAI